MSTTKIKPPIFIIEKNYYLTKKRNLSLTNQPSLSTSISPKRKCIQDELISNNKEEMVDLNNNLNETKDTNLPIFKKGKWSEEEDNLLMKYVKKYGVGKWNKIERCLIGRTRKQIRQRYISNIKIKKISEEMIQNISYNSYSSSDEDECEGILQNEQKIIFKWDDNLDKILLKEYFLNKKSWVKISKKIPGSSENSVKNRFYSLLRQKVNKTKKEFKGVVLNSHYWLYNWNENDDNEDSHKKYFIQNYQLCRYWNSLKAGPHLPEKEQKDYLERLGKEALKNLELDVVEEAFRMSKNTSLVLTVEQLKRENEKKIMLGSIAAILGEEDLAQELFIESSQPEKALDLRMDLQDWDVAFKLAKEYNVLKVPFISRKLAYQYETQNNVQEAMSLYQSSTISNPLNFLNKINDDYDLKDLEFHNQQCLSGISRCSFRLGDTVNGLEKAQQLTDKNLTIEVASLCESLNYGLEAAKLYTQVNLYEKAATIFIKMKLFKSAEDLMDKIKSPKLLIQLAKMKEVEKLYNDAEKAYVAASDWENAIRINLKFLDNPDRARDILMKHCKTETAANLLSEYFESKGKKVETIEYKLIAKRYDEAFAIAQSYNKMDIYGEFMLKNNKNIDEFKKIAIYYEGKNDFGDAGIFYEKDAQITKITNCLRKSCPKMKKTIDLRGKM